MYMTWSHLKENSWSGHRRDGMASKFPYKCIWVAGFLRGVETSRDTCTPPYTF